MPVDPYYLIDEAKKFSANLPLVFQARKTNEEAGYEFLQEDLK